MKWNYNFLIFQLCYGQIRCHSQPTVGENTKRSHQKGFVPRIEKNTIKTSQSILNSIWSLASKHNFNQVNEYIVMIIKFLINFSIEFSRNFIYYLSAEKYRATNPNCRVKTEILSNREEPQITVSFGKLIYLINS